MGTIHKYFELSDGKILVARAIVDPVSGKSLEINSDGQLKVVLDGTVDTNNTSQETLGAGIAFQGTATETLNYALIFVTVYSDVASATDGLCIEVSTDNVTWRDGDCYTIAAATSKTFSFQPSTRYFRVKYTNGGAIQSAFDLQTIVKKTNSKPSSHRIADQVSDQDDAELTKSVLTGEDPVGSFSNVQVTTDGNLAITDQSDGLSIAQGLVTGTSFIHKFGAAPDFDTGDGFVTIWDGADDGDIAEMQYIYSTSAIIDSISSANNSDTMDVEVQGLDSNYDLIVQTITLTGQTRKALDTNLIRVFRIKNVDSVNFNDHIYVYENTPLSGGVPVLTNKIRAMVHSENNQTEMAVFTIPAGKTGYMRSWYASTAGAKRDSSHTIDLLARPHGGVFQLKHKSNLDVNGTSYIHHEYVEPEKFTEKTDIEMRADTDQDIAGVAGGFDIVLIDN